MIFGLFGQGNPVVPILVLLGVAVELVSVDTLIDRGLVHLVNWRVILFGRRTLPL